MSRPSHLTQWSARGLRARTGSIRTRLLLAFVLMAVLSAFAISVGSMIVGYFNGRQQVQDRLDSVTALKSLSIKSWEDTLQTGLLTISSDQFASQRVSVVLGLAKLGKEYVWYDDALRFRLRTFIEESRQIDEICLLDVRGTAVLCSGQRQTPQDCSVERFYQRGLTSKYTEIFFSPNAATLMCDILSPGIDAPIVIVARPVTSSEGEALGVIVGRAGSRGLIQILADRTGLGSTGKAYLVSSAFALLPDVATTSTPYGSTARLGRSPGVDTTLGNHSKTSGIFDDYNGQSVLGTYQWVPDLQMVLAVEQSTSEAFSGIFQGLVVNSSIAVLAALAAVGLAFSVTGSITRPLVSLVETASQIAAGNLDRTAPVMRDDEIGMLATSFNSMTTQLRDLISHLEQRVEKRTRALNQANEALRRRALHMETSAQVSRQITSILEIDELLTHVVLLIRDAFGYSQARIFLLDGEELVLRASTSESVLGVVRLQVALTNLNSEAVQTGQAVVVNDVSTEPRFLKEERLPDIRSELAIPLHVAGRVIGTLDVLSVQPNSFTAEDLLVLTSLGDQIAVAIENARLYARTRDMAVLEERDRLARDLHDSVIQSIYSLSLLFEGWRRLMRQGVVTNIEEHFDRAASIAHQVLREMRLMVFELRPAALERDGLLGAFQQRLDAVERRAGVKARLIAENLMDLPLPVQECLQLIPRTGAGVPSCQHGTSHGCRQLVLGDALYHIGVEALSNALKYSEATEVTLRLFMQSGQLQLVVTDNGRGFETSSPESRGGMGLNNMRQRAESVGGDLSVESEIGRGTIVTARVGCAAFTATESLST